MLSPRAAVTAVFLVNGFVFVSWYSRLPDIQRDLDIGDGALGVALLGAPLGLLLAMPLAGALTAAIGSRPLVMAAPSDRMVVTLIAAGSGVGRASAVRADNG